MIFRLLLILFISFQSTWAHSSMCFELFSPKIKGFSKSTYLNSLNSYRSQGNEESFSKITQKLKNENVKSEELIAFFDSLSNGKEPNLYEQMTNIRGLKVSKSFFGKSVRSGFNNTLQKKLILPRKASPKNAEEMQTFIFEVAQVLQRHQLRISSLFFINKLSTSNHKIQQVFKDTSLHLQRVIQKFRSLQGINEAILPTDVPRKSAFRLLVNGMGQLLLPVSSFKFYYKDYLIESNNIKLLNMHLSRQVDVQNELKRNTTTRWISRNVNSAIYSVILALSILPAKQAVEGFIELNKQSQLYENAAMEVISKKSSNDYVNEAFAELNEISEIN